MLRRLQVNFQKEKAVVFAEILALYFIDNKDVQFNHLFFLFSFVNHQLWKKFLSSYKNLIFDMSEIFCPNCGKKYTTSYRYCSSCGEELEEQQRRAEFEKSRKRRKVPSTRTKWIAFSLFMLSFIATLVFYLIVWNYDFAFIFMIIFGALTGVFLFVFLRQRRRLYYKD